MSLPERLYSRKLTWSRAKPLTRHSLRVAYERKHYAGAGVECVNCPIVVVEWVDQQTRDALRHRFGYGVARRQAVHRTYLVISGGDAVVSRGDEAYRVARAHEEIAVPIDREA